MKYLNYRSRIGMILETLCRRTQDSYNFPGRGLLGSRIRDGHFRLANINVVSLVCTVFGSLPDEIIRDIIQDVDIRRA